MGAAHSGRGGTGAIEAYDPFEAKPVSSSHNAYEAPKATSAYDAPAYGDDFYASGGGGSASSSSSSSSSNSQNMDDYSAPRPVAKTSSYGALPTAAPSGSAYGSSGMSTGFSNLSPDQARAKDEELTRREKELEQRERDLASKYEPNTACGMRPEERERERERECVCVCV